MQDGITENFTAAVIEPYCRCGGTGLSYVDPALLNEYVAELDRHGFQVHFHAIGERAVREALDSFEGTDPANRHHIAHLQIIEPSDVPRFAALGVTANLQPLWATHHAQMDELTIPFLGERAVRPGSIRSPTCCAPAPGSARAATGRSPTPTRSRACTWPSTAPSRAARCTRTTRRRRPRSCPARRWTWPPR